MSQRIANSTGNFSSSATWDQGTNTPTLHASTNTTISTSNSYSATFTAPNTSNKVTGVTVLLISAGSANTITATLQEDITGTSSWLDTAATATITLSSVYDNSFLYFQYSTGYTFATTGANRYRWKLVCGTSTLTVAADSGGSLFGYVSWDNRHVVPVSGDNVFCIGSNNSTPITVTLDGTQTIGSNVNASRGLNNALNISNGGELKADTAASCQLTLRGSFGIFGGGLLTVGSSGTPYPAAQTANFIFDQTTGIAGLTVIDNGKAQLYGAPKSSTSLWKTKYVSGIGTAASPLVVSDSVDWNVGDEILISPTSANPTNYNETESRFIITKNSATSYVLSTSKGGSEAAYTYTHSTDAWVLNIERNIFFNNVGASARGFYHFSAQTNAGNVNIAWVRFQNIDGTLFFGIQPLYYTQIGQNVTCDYSVTCHGSAALWNLSSTNVPMTHTGLIAYNTYNTGGGATNYTTGNFVIIAKQNLTLNDCFSMLTGTNGMTGTAAYSNTFNRCYVFGSNFNNTVANAAGVTLASSGQNVFNDCEFHANRGTAVLLSSSVGDTYNNCLFGTKGVNQTNDIGEVTSSYNTCLFDGSTFGSATRLNNYRNATLGSEIRFNRLNDTDNNHIWYTVFGSAQSTGVSLSDTLIRTPGSLAVRLTPENNSSGFVWDFNIPSKSGSITSFTGWFYKNATFGSSTARVELWLPGSTSADASQTLSNTTGAWQAVSISAINTQAVDGLAVIKVIGITNTAGAYLYCDDFYNSGNTIVSTDRVTGLDIWYQGEPQTIIAPSATSAADIWTFPTANLNTSNTTGNQVKKLLTLAKYLGLK